MRPVILAALARRDINDAWSYLAHEAGNFDAADALREQIDQGIDKISKSPGVGHFRNELAEPPVRFWRVQRYLVVYRESQEAILVSRILHESRDVRSILETHEE